MPEQRRSHAPLRNGSPRPRKSMVLYVTMGGMAVKATRSAKKGKYKGQLRVTINTGTWTNPHWEDAEDRFTAEYHLARDAYEAAEKIIGAAQD